MFHTLRFGRDSGTWDLGLETRTLGGPCFTKGRSAGPHTLHDSVVSGTPNTHLQDIARTYVRMTDDDDDDDHNTNTTIHFFDWNAVSLERPRPRRRRRLARVDAASMLHSLVSHLY